MREVTLPSGAILAITPAPFEDAKNLYQAVLAELRGVPVSFSTDMAAIYKELACIGFSSPVIEARLWKCFERCTYAPATGNDLTPQKMDRKTTFDPDDRRQDYITACMEVAKDNIGPFGKSLYAVYLAALEAQKVSQK